jgi:hypothetical protein
MSNSRLRPLRLNVPSESRPHSPSGSNWLDPLITCLKGITSLSALSPFPFVGRSAENVVLLLERLQVIRLLFISEARTIDVSSQKMEKNRDDLRQLAQRLVDIVVIIRDDIIARGETAAPRYKAICLEFISCVSSCYAKSMPILIYRCSYLDGISRELNTAKRKNKYWFKPYVKVNDISDTIKTFEIRVDDLRRNLAVGDFT